MGRVKEQLNIYDVGVGKQPLVKKEKDDIGNSKDWMLFQQEEKD